ncbi:MAG: enoyl-CoA hydratase/isomerase family protein [Burkholderiales bacterium]|nr:enoyl-CoA hydratase/isomerase family protein [Burkholderiales bacterium]
MSAPLLVEIRDAVATLTLNRPEIRNAFDDAQIERLTKALRDLEADAGVRVVVIAGNGPAFCAGADLNWMKRMAGYSYAQNLADAQALAGMLRTLDRMTKPTIARVHGPAFAGGTGLVAACDIALGTPQAKFCLSEAKLGLSPATISPYVVRAMGARMARRYFLTAEVFDAEEAHRVGLLSALVSADALDAALEGIVAQLLAGGPRAIAEIKDLIRAVSAGPLDDAMIADTARRIAEIRVTEEGREGIAAFLEKRKPAWTVRKA